MIYRFKIVSEETDKFRREIEIDPEESFMALRNAILDSVGYTKDEISTFFICDDDWKRQDEVAIEDFGSSSDQDLWSMDDTRISELIEEEGQKIEFVFDGLTERSFFMELKEILTGKKLTSPICTLKEGKAPAQHVDIEQFEKSIETKAAEISKDLDMDFYGDSEFNEEEIGDGFDDLSFQ